MNETTRLEHVIVALRERLTRLSEASLRINETLDLDSVLSQVVDGARALTAARYGALTVSEAAGLPPRFFTSGLTAEEYQGLVDMPGGMRLFERLSTISEPLRIADFSGHARSMGLPELQLSVPLTSVIVAPIRHGGVAEGAIYVAGEEGREFTREDEETLVMFASQAALVIANARRYQDEQRTRADLEALISTSPMGVVVFDARTGDVVSFNRETARILEYLRIPDRPIEHLLEVASVTRADGRRFSLDEFPVAEVLATGEAVHAEEIVIGVPDGRRVTTLINSTPIYSEEGGELRSVVVTIQDMTQLEELERQRAEFLGMVSHELRTPLSTIMGSTATLLEASPEMDPAEVRQFHRIIYAQADRMRELISDLLDVAHIETGTLSVNPESSEVAALVDQARNGFLSGGGGLDVHIDIPIDLPPVMADRRRIVQVLTNLLANAARHSQGSAPSQVTAAVDDSLRCGLGRR